MTRDAEYKFKIVFTAGEVPAPGSIVESITATIYTALNEPAGTEGNGLNITAVDGEAGAFLIEIPRQTTMKLTTGREAWIDGFTAPVRKSFRINLGMVKSNKSEGR